MEMQTSSELSPTDPKLNQGSPFINPDYTPSISAEQQQRSLRHACLCAKVADEFRGTDTIVIDLTKITPIVDYFVISTGTSRRQMHAIAEEVDSILKAEGSKRIGLEGYDDSSWILQDYGDVVLHVFTEEAREIYDLEHLWADAPQIDWRAVLEAGTE